jgi:precorrin-6B methylase 2
MRLILIDIAISKFTAIFINREIKIREVFMITFEMTKDEANIVQNVIERYLYHLQVEIMHTDKREFRDALKQREKFLKDIIDRMKTKILAESK